MDIEASVDPVTVVELRASNVMRLTAVEIRPDPKENVVVISGPNASGKSSILNAIWLALGGGKAAKGVPVPIHRGAEEGEVTLDLGRFIVTRTFRHGKQPTLVVKSPDGARFERPQSFLDEFLGEFTFDPLSFMRQTAKEQLTTLLGMVDLPFDLDELNRQYESRFAARTVIGRERDQLQARFAAAPTPDEATPETEVSIAELLVAAQDARGAIAEREAAVQALKDAGATKTRCEENVARLEAELEVARAAVVTSAAAQSAALEVYATLPPAPDLAGIESRLLAAEGTNQQVRAAAEYRKLRDAAQDAAERYEGETLELHLLEAKKRKGIKEATMPLDGLSFDDNQVLFNDVPLQQASGAEQLRVSMAIGMAVNPKVRVMCIPDASLLDSESLALVAALAKERSFQVWLERVADDGEGVGFVIEDGTVRP